MAPLLSGRDVLVTGGAGAFGRAFVRRALSDGAKRVVVYSRSEANHAAMRAEFANDRIRFIIGDVRDYTRLLDACRGVEIVVHAAALKRVEVCRDNPSEANATNIDGTENVARACVAAGVERAVYLSTDKAASPSTHYGATKLAGESTWCNWNAPAARTKTRFAATRYGNVAGSTGSVIPIWKAQASTGQVTITDPRCTRFLMSMACAVDLVVTALTEMRGGEIFVPVIRAARVTDLADVVAPGCTQVTTGLRGAEKIHETLITDDEVQTTYRRGDHFVIEPAERSWTDAIPEPIGYRVAEGFVYRSDSWMMTPDELRALVAA